MKRRKFLGCFTKTGLLWTVAAPTLIFARKSIAQAQSLRNPAVLAAQAQTSTPYVAGCSEFDGTHDYMARGGDLTGSADGKLATISFWFLANADTVVRYIYNSTGNSFLVNLSAANRVLVQSGASGQMYSSTGKALAGTGWHHALITIDMASSAGQRIYIDGISDKNASSLTNVNIDHTVENHSIGAGTDATSKMNGYVSDVYIDFANCLDITNASVRELFRISATGKPSDISANIASSALANPIIWMHGSGNDFNVNSGTGGNFTVTGSLGSCSGPSA